MRKGYDDFILLLVIVFVILLILFLLTPWLSPIVTEPDEVQLANFTIGDVGFVSETATRQENIGNIFVGETQFENLKNIYKTSIVTGMFGDDSDSYTINVPEYLTDTIRGIKITFTVKETNQYGDLNFIWNGKEIFSQRASVNQHTINIEKDMIVTSNSLEIKADGPGALFWANTVYELRDVSVDVDYGPSRIVTFDLQQSELDAWSKGSITFFATGSGDLTVKVNGVQLFRDDPLGHYAVDFALGDVPLYLGRNIISFSSAGLINMQNAKLDIYLLSDKVVRTRFFDLSEEHYNLLESGQRTGEVRYYVTDIYMDGAIMLESETGLIGSGHPSTGWNSFDFDSTYFALGRNMLKFSGNGHWEITDVEVVLV